MTILPLSTSTASEKLRTILLVVATAVALSAGEEELKEGSISSKSAIETVTGWRDSFPLLSVALTTTT